MRECVFAKSKGDAALEQQVTIRWEGSAQGSPPIPGAPSGSPSSLMLKGQEGVRLLPAARPQPLPALPMLVLLRGTHTCRAVGSSCEHACCRLVLELGAVPSLAGARGGGDIPQRVPSGPGQRVSVLVLT